ncbi:MAG: T9SS type A sorting domain-containing protein [Prolixibacteraceae bacterium]|nr:T9SS type A sorting domain-containing protein [Prolixibacteraceae bacterium]
MGFIFMCRKYKLTSIFILLVAVVQATNYYVDATYGNDNYNGKSPVLAWQSIERVNIASLNPGDSILFKRGEIFRGNLIAQGGESGKPVVYGAYGIGAKPRILGSYNRSLPENWKNTGNNIWETSNENTEVKETELLPNGSLTSNISDWYSWKNEESGTNAFLSRATGPNEYYDSPAGLKLECTNNGNSVYDLQVFTTEWEIKETEWYKLTFYARATESFTLKKRDIILMQSLSPFTEYSYKTYSKNLNFNNNWQKYEIYFKVNVSAKDCRLTLFLGNTLPENSVLYLDAFSLKECENNPEFMDLDIGNLIFNEGNFCGTKVFSENDLTSQGDFWYDANNQLLKIRSETNPVNYYTSIELARSEHIIEYYYKAYTIIENLDLRYGAQHGINCVDSHDLTVRNVDFSYIGGGTLNSNQERLGNGIQFWNNAQNIVVEKCVFNQVYDAAISPQGSSSEEVEIHGIYIRNNIISNSEYSFEFWENGQNITLRHVYFENNTCLYAGGGWSHSQRSDPNGTHLMFFENDADCSDFYIRNNIFYQASDWGVRWARLSNLKDAVIDYNCWYSETGAIARVKDYIFESEDGLESLKNTSGHAAHSLLSDPLLYENILLNEQSPCIGSGTVLQTVSDDFFGIERSMENGYDIGAVNANDLISLEQVDLCDGESYKGFRQTGKYIQSYSSGQGTDSIVITNLTVYPQPVPKVIVKNDTLTSNAEYYNYQWFDEDGEIIGENSGKLVISKSGNYYLEITDAHGCTGTSEKVHVFFSGTNIPEENTVEFSILPNPNNGDFLFRIESSNKKDLTIHIINLLGQILVSKTIRQPKQNQTVKISLPQLKAGVYIVVVSSVNFNNSKKFIVY